MSSVVGIFVPVLTPALGTAMLPVLGVMEETTTADVELKKMRIDES